MNRSRLAGTLFLIAGLLALGGLGLGRGPVVGADEVPAPRQPNIVLVLVDDLDIDPQTLASMRQVQTRLAGQGTSFSHAFVPVSLCCPSRVSLLRGEFPHNHAVFSNFPPDGGFARFRDRGLESSTVATALQEAGYRTVLLGKYLNGYPARGGKTYVPPGWDEWYVPASNAGYGGYNYELNENGTLVSYGNAASDYATDLLAAKANDFIRRTAAAGRPFFLFLSTFAAHRPAIPASRHQALFPGVRAPRTPSFDEADMRDKPVQYRRAARLGPGDIAYMDGLYRMRLQSLQAVDDAVAGLVRTLRATGQLGNTYLVFTSDNGHHLGQHRFLAGKFTAYEEDIRVPLIVRGPGVPAGRVRGDLVLSIDLAPTFAQLAGTRMPQADGRSLVPLLGESTAPSRRKVVLIEQRPYGADPHSGEVEPGEKAPWPPVRYAGLRTRSYKYVEYANGERELYDLAADPYELENRAATLDPAVRSRLSGLLAALKRCAGQSCRTLDATAPPAAFAADAPGASGAAARP